MFDCDYITENCLRSGAAENGEASAGSLSKYQFSFSSAAALTSAMEVSISCIS